MVGPEHTSVEPLARGDDRPVLAILTTKAGWFRHDDELAAHERAVRVLGWCPVSLPIRPDASADELAAFIGQARPSLIWARGGVELPSGFPSHLAAHPAPVLACLSDDPRQPRSAVQEAADVLLSPGVAWTSDASDGGPPIRLRPRGVDQAILDEPVRSGPGAVRGDVSVLHPSPSPRLRETVTALQDAAKVVTYGAGWDDRSWFEPDGRAALVALASAPVHLAEAGPGPSLPHSVFCAAAAGAALLVLGDDHAHDAFDVGIEITAVRGPDDAAAAFHELRSDEDALRRMRGAARSRVEADHRLEEQWRSLLVAHGADR